MDEMTHDTWTDRLSEYLDGELPGPERAALEEHLAACSECRSVLGELARVVSRASALGSRPPEPDLWPGIAARLGAAERAGGPGQAGGAWRWASPSVLPRLAAASVALALLAGGGLWLAQRPSPPGVAVGPGAPEGVAAPAVAFAGAADAAIQELERALAENRSRLDPTTVEVVEANLTIIDAAIADARRALAEDPGSAYVNLHLADTMNRKLQLLRDVNALAARTL